MSENAQLLRRTYQASAATLAMPPRRAGLYTWLIMVLLTLAGTISLSYAKQNYKFNCVFEYNQLYTLSESPDIAKAHEALREYIKRTETGLTTNPAMENAKKLLDQTKYGTLKIKTVLEDGTPCAGTVKFALENNKWAQGGNTPLEVSFPCNKVIYIEGECNKIQSSANYRLDYTETKELNIVIRKNTGNRNSTFANNPLESASLVRLLPSSLDASSYIDSQEKHPAKHAFDGNPKTAWNEAGPGPGNGEWIRARFASTQQVRKITFSTGYDAYSTTYGDLFALNSHYKTLRLVTDQETITREISENTREIDIELDVATSSLQFIADDVWPGTKWNDLCVSEIKIWGVKKKGGKAAIGKAPATSNAQPASKKKIVLPDFNQAQKEW